MRFGHIASVTAMLISSLAAMPAGAQRLIDSRAANITSTDNPETTSITVAEGSLQSVSLSPIIAALTPRRPGMVSTDQDPPNLPVVSDAPRRSRGRNALIGTGVGAAVGAGVGIALSFPSSGEGSMVPPPFIVAGGAIVGALLGSVIGAIVPTGESESGR